MGVVHPERSILTGLTGAAHRSNRCRGLVGLASGEHLGEFSIILCCCCFEFGSFCSTEGQVRVFGASWLRLL
jgi:hypothetical protein